MVPLLILLTLRKSSPVRESTSTMALPMPTRSSSRLSLLMRKTLLNSAVSMARKRKQDQTEVILQAALTLADKGGWDSLTFAAIAKKARTSESAVKAQFSDIWDILAAVLK